MIILVGNLVKAGATLLSKEIGVICVICGLFQLRICGLIVIQ
jgi:hypothetical protein